MRTHLVTMLNAKPNAAKIMKEVLMARLGTRVAIHSTFSSRVNVNIFWSQNEGPAYRSISAQVSRHLNAPKKPVIMNIVTIIRMPSTGPEKTLRYIWPRNGRQDTCCTERGYITDQYDILPMWLNKSLRGWRLAKQRSTMTAQDSMHKQRG
jgi:hypothetical protein